MTTPNGEGTMTDLTLRRVELGGARVAYRETGDGAPILFVHGYPQSSRTWRKVMPRLQDRYRCIAVDLLGAGDSEVSESANLSVPAQAAMLEAFLDALGLRGVALIAYDSGAVIGRLLASTHPDRFRLFVLSDTEVRGRVVPSVVAMQRLLRLPGASSVFAALSRSRMLLRSRFGLGTIVYDRSSFDFDEFVAVTMEPLRRSPRRMRASLRFAAQYDLRFADRLSHEQLTMPKLVVWGANDHAFPIAWGRELYESLPDPKDFATIAECGGLPHEERPAEWLAAVEPFLARIS
jgi:pimeloyl-ACP methyl ester carboxylesterase